MTSECLLHFHSALRSCDEILSLEIPSIIHHYSSFLDQILDPSIKVVNLESSYASSNLRFLSDLLGNCIVKIDSMGLNTRCCCQVAVNIGRTTPSRKNSQSRLPNMELKSFLWKRFNFLSQQNKLNEYEIDIFCWSLFKIQT